MKESALEQFLAKIYVDPAARARFLAAPRTEAAHAGLSEKECRALEKIDRIGLEMAARSFANKRARKQAAKKTTPLMTLIRRIFTDTA